MRFHIHLVSYRRRIKIIYENNNFKETCCYRDITISVEGSTEEREPEAHNIKKKNTLYPPGSFLHICCIWNRCYAYLIFLLRGLFALFEQCYT